MRLRAGEANEGLAGPVLAGLMSTINPFVSREGDALALSRRNIKTAAPDPSAAAAFLVLLTPGQDDD